MGAAREQNLEWGHTRVGASGCEKNSTRWREGGPTSDGKADAQRAVLGPCTTRA
ncbi:hypothetical protein FH972_024167 [Carpinus fangiana]|uniref:Uncharacterized protein n=1 Tax=Carpinus fangiana TaxID=176857 RepID=A0A5N6KXL3_9ROSI|nr:hypothetical protein FH972_024167 [Carpinus fangiana]